MSRKFRLLLGIGLLTAAAGVAAAQVGSKTTTTMGESTKATATRTVHAEIIDVSGNTVIAKTAEGTREYKVPEGFKFQMDGKDIGVEELKPGMKVTATITTTTTVTPVTVTEVRQAEVLAVSGTAIIVRGPQGNRMWTGKDVAERNIKIFREGKEVGIADLKVGDRLTATIVSQKPPQRVSEQKVKAMVHGEAAAPAPAPAAEAAPAPAPAPAPAAEAPAKKLPKTASQVPLVGLAGVLSLFAGLGLTVSRRRRSR
ncbi:MAG: LPXTG cell wall anchor domain-containing protein [Acidithiobacillales bacterium]